MTTPPKRTASTKYPKRPIKGAYLITWECPTQVKVDCLIAAILPSRITPQMMIAFMSFLDAQRGFRDTISEALHYLRHKVTVIQQDFGVYVTTLTPFLKARKVFDLYAITNDEDTTLYWKEYRYPLVTDPDKDYLPPYPVRAFKYVQSTNTIEDITAP